MKEITFTIFPTIIFFFCGECYAEDKIYLVEGKVVAIQPVKNDQRFFDASISVIEGFKGKRAANLVGKSFVAETTDKPLPGSWPLVIYPELKVNDLGIWAVKVDKDGAPHMCGWLVNDRHWNIIQRREKDYLKIRAELEAQKSRE